MKTKELMIGDWVLKDMNFLEDDPMYTRTEYQPYQIIRGEDIDLACETNWLGDDVYQPIPLTPEILEKNGFRKQNNSSGIIRLDTYWLGEEIGFRLHGIETDYYQFGLAKIRYVHELQHALRLCNIPKEIEI